MMKTNFLTAELAVAILFHDKVKQTIECLSSLQISGVPIYILNNNSSVSARIELDRWLSKQKGLFPDWKISVFDSKVNFGVAGGRNFLLEHTNEKWLFFLDNDCRVLTRNWFLKWQNAKEKFSEVEVFLPSLFEIHNCWWLELENIEIIEGRITTSLPQARELNNLAGGCAIINRGLFERLGKYDVKFLSGFEDLELAVRGILSEKPIRARLLRTIKVVHDHQIQILPQDQEAIRIRYSYERMKQSYDHFLNKHNLSGVDENWNEWRQAQIDALINGNRRSRWSNLLHQLQRKIKLQFKKTR